LSELRRISWYAICPSKTRITTAMKVFVARKRDDAGGSGAEGLASDISASIFHQ
jgi:hypothetical protein